MRPGSCLFEQAVAYSNNRAIVLNRPVLVFVSLRLNGNKLQIKQKQTSNQTETIETATVHISLKNSNDFHKFCLIKGTLMQT